MLGSKLPIWVQHLHIKVCLDVFLFIILLHFMKLIHILMSMNMALMRLACSFLARKLGERHDRIRLIFLWLESVFGHHDILASSFVILLSSRVIA